MDIIKTCTKCNQRISIVNFSQVKKPKKDGTFSYDSQCRGCRAAYIYQRRADPEDREKEKAYMRQKREDPIFREKEKLYL